MLPHEPSSLTPSLTADYLLAGSEENCPLTKTPRITIGNPHLKVILVQKIVTYGISHGYIKRKDISLRIILFFSLRMYQQMAAAMINLGVGWVPSNHTPTLDVICD